MTAVMKCGFVCVCVCVCVLGSVWLSREGLSMTQGIGGGERVMGGLV